MAVTRFDPATAPLRGELIPALLGKNALPKYQGYNPYVNPGIANEFSGAVFRLGHSMLGDDIELVDNDGTRACPLSLWTALDIGRVVDTLEDSPTRIRR